MFSFIKSFRNQEDGAVTVDWVVLTAVVIGLSIGLLLMITQGATETSSSVGAALSSQEIPVY